MARHRNTETEPNKRIKTIRSAHSTVQELRTCTAFYSQRLAMKTIIVAILLAASAPAMAKCIDVHQDVSGVVSDSNGKPVEGAVVRVFWLEHGEKRSELGTSDAQGHFAIHFIFNAYSGAGLLGEDRCEGKLESFEVSASKEQTQSRPRVLRASEKPVALSLTLTKGNG